MSYLDLTINTSGCNILPKTDLREGDVQTRCTHVPHLSLRPVPQLDDIEPWFARAPTD
jgi:hypothetical protein